LEDAENSETTLMQEILTCVSSLAAIASITYLEKKAMECGINGKLFAGSMAMIAALGGYCVRDLIALL